MKIISIIGTGRKSGKTFLIERIVKKLNEKGIKYAVVKKVHKEDFTIDKEGKDTFRYYKSGAKDIFIYSKREIVHIKKTEDFDENYILKLLKSVGYDLVIFEGNFNCDKKILVANDEKICLEIIKKEKNVKLIVSRNLSEINGIKCLNIERDFDKIMEFILEGIE